MPNHRAKLSWPQSSPVVSHVVQPQAPLTGGGGVRGAHRPGYKCIPSAWGCVHPSRTWPTVLPGTESPCLTVYVPWTDSYMVCGWRDKEAGKQDQRTWGLELQRTCLVLSVARQQHRCPLKASFLTLRTDGRGLYQLSGQERLGRRV